MKYVMILLALALAGCANTEGIYQQHHSLLVAAEKAGITMKRGLAAQATGSALGVSGEETYREGKEEKEAAIAELNSLL